MEENCEIIGKISKKDRLNRPKNMKNTEEKQVEQCNDMENREEK